MTQSNGGIGSGAGSAANGANGVLDAYEQRVADIARRAEQVREQMAAVRPSATSPDGAVTATVTSAGVLADLSFGPSARDLDLHQLAALVLRTSQQAHRSAALQTQAVLTPLVGADSAALDFMREALPDDEELDDAPPSATAEDTVDRSVRDTPPPAPPLPPAPRQAAAEPAEDDGFTGRGA